MQFESLSPYRLTLVAAIVVLVLSVGVLFVVLGPSAAAPYATIVASMAVPGLFGLFKIEQTAKVQAEQHVENQSEIATTQQNIVATNAKLDALQRALSTKGDT